MVKFPYLKGSNFIQQCEAAELTSLQPEQIHGNLKKNPETQPSPAEYYMMDHVSQEVVLEREREDELFKMLGITDAAMLPIRKGVSQGADQDTSSVCIDDGSSEGSQDSWDGTMPLLVQPDMLQRLAALK